MSKVWPTELRVSSDKRVLTVRFDDGSSHSIAAELLRVRSPSAEVKGHGPGQEVTVPGKRNVTITTVIPTGNYAIRIGFHDGHDTGIYTWDYLKELGENGAAIFADYEAELAAKGLGRD